MNTFIKQTLKKHKLNFLCVWYVGQASIYYNKQLFYIDFLFLYVFIEKKHLGDAPL